MKVKKLALLFTITLMTSLTYSQSLHNEIQSIYNFEPHKLSDSEQELKSKFLDKFWDKIKSNKEKYLDSLRNELKDTSNSAFFAYDCGHLLLSISKTKTDYDIAFNSTLRASLDDIQHLNFLETMNDFALKGYNTTVAGLKVIKAKEFKDFVPQHSLEIDKTIALEFILLPIETELYIDKVLAELNICKDTSTIKNILYFLDYTCCCKADSMINLYSQDKNQETCIRDYASLIKKNNSKILRIVSKSGYLKQVEKRKKALSRISDEALFDLDIVTNNLKGRYNCH